MAKQPTPQGLLAEVVLTPRELSALARLGPFTGLTGTEYAILYTQNRVDDLGILFSREEAFGIAVACEGVVVERTHGTDWAISDG